MNLNNRSERADSRRKPRFPRLQLQRQRRREDEHFRLIDGPDDRVRYPMYCH